MKRRLFTPGPSPVPEETLLELAKPVGYHRSAEAKSILGEVSELLKYVFQTQNRVLTLTSSGTGAMEAAVVNSLAPGEKAIVCTAGKWGERFKQLTNVYQAETIVLEAPYGQAVTPEQLDAALKQHPDTKAVFAQLSETSTGIGHDIQAFGKLVAQTDAVFVVDGISGLAAMECRTDDWKLDIVVTGSQKAFMMPPGLAFISVSDKAWTKIDAMPVRSYYFDLRKYRQTLDEGPDTPFTPANTLIKAQLVSLKMIRNEGIENLWQRHARIAGACRAAVQAMGLALFPERPNNALTVVKVPSGFDGSATLKKLEKQHGYKFADGQGSMRGTIWRLAHMGYTDAFEVIGALAALELVLIEGGFNMEPGAGVAAFQKAYVDTI